MRNQGWEKRLEVYLENQSDKPFVWGKNDCVLFAALGASEVLGRDLSEEIGSYGQYDEETAAGIIAAHGGIRGIFDKHFPRKLKTMVQRGDIALVNVQGNEVAGIVDNTGRHVAVKRIDGKLGHIPMKQIICAWGVI